MNKKNLRLHIILNAKNLLWIQVVTAVMAVSILVAAIFFVPSESGNKLRLFLGVVALVFFRISRQIGMQAQKFATKEIKNMEKIHLLNELILSIAASLKITFFKIPIYYEDIAITPNMSEGYAPAGLQKDNKIVIYKNSIGHFWVYSEPGDPYYWYRYDSLEKFLEGYFKEPIRVSALEHGRKFYDGRNIGTALAASRAGTIEALQKIAEEKGQQERVRLEKELRMYFSNKKVYNLQNAIFN